jgi:adenosylcobinamide-phosphate synthase
MLHFPPLSEAFLASTVAIVVGVLLDAVLGDPPNLPHLVRAIGWLIERSEKLLRRKTPDSPEQELRQGRWLVLSVLGIVGALMFVLLGGAYFISIWLGAALEALLAWQCIALQDLKVQSTRVQRDLAAGNIDAARGDLSLIVGRDTETLNEPEIARAAVETVAENTSDGVIAPLLALLLAGGFGGAIYKAVNTLDSMVGYRNERYEYFGRAGAKLDDLFNWVPARLSALLLILAAALARNDWKGAWRIWRRDHANHQSPNSAHPEAAVAGALGVQLGGSASYHGVPSQKPLIGDPKRPLEYTDIAKANKLARISAYSLLIPLVLARLILWEVIWHV